MRVSKCDFLDYRLTHMYDICLDCVLVTVNCSTVTPRDEESHVKHVLLAVLIPAGVVAAVSTVALTFYRLRSVRT